LQCSPDKDDILKESLCCETKEWKLLNCQDVATQVIIMLYFALTTLSTVGYGDLYPISQREMMLGMFFMFFGIVFFS
jgi:hypothetical protein